MYPPAERQRASRQPLALRWRKRQDTQSQRPYDQSMSLHRLVTSVLGGTRKHAEFGNHAANRTGRSVQFEFPAPIKVDQKLEPRI
jgi:hypothetical protein